MSPTFPHAGAWIPTLVDLAGCCVFIAAGLWICEPLTDSIPIQVAGVVLAMWFWDWFFAMLRGTFSNSLERRSR